MGKGVLNGHSEYLEYASSVMYLSTRPNISESHSEISTRVPFCIADGPSAVEAIRKPTAGEHTHLPLAFAVEHVHGGARPIHTCDIVQLPPSSSSFTLLGETLMVLLLGPKFCPFQ